METKKLSAAQIALLKKPLPKEAIKPHPTKNFLSTIKAIYVIERLNEVFGIGTWKQNSNVIEKDGKMIVVQSWLRIPEYGIEIEAFGGNDNADRGDAYKGACTDALTKMASALEIGMDVYKGLATHSQDNAPANGSTAKAPALQPNTNFTGEKKELVPGMPAWKKAVDHIANGHPWEKIENSYFISNGNKIAIESEAKAVKKVA